MDDKGAGYWLWVDPHREQGYDPKNFDQAAFMAQAVALFQTKDRWGSQQPGTVKANPAQTENGLKLIAQG